MFVAVQFAENKMPCIDAICAAHVNLIETGLLSEYREILPFNMLSARTFR